MVKVYVKNVSKLYGKNYALRSVNLHADDGALVCVLGPSGSGKSTLLKIVAGLLYPDEGEVYFDDDNVTNVPVWKRNVGLVFQNIALFPHLSVYENIAFGAKLRKMPKAEIDAKVKELLKLVKLEGYERRKPSELSGGEAQRVAIARTLMTNPRVLLFDEPLGHLDAKLREELKFEIRRIVKETGKTSLYVTHDQSEAFAIADYIYVINRGVIEQGGTPLELYEKPVSPFIAEFIGSMNFLRGEVYEIDPVSRTAKVSAGGLTLFSPAREDLKPGDRVLLGVRPDDIKIVTSAEEDKLKAEEPAANTIPGMLYRKIFVGQYLRLEVDIGGELMKVDAYGDAKYNYSKINPGSKVYLVFTKSILFKL
ncbi:ABC transporter ATP-binding protein [Thermofilum sp.]|uniref:ABC transporter ATP-binding protein n=1 Tax=Thermofilum sp. TaxID=1961369 RepID=UPI0031689503